MLASNIGFHCNVGVFVEQDARCKNREKNLIETTTALTATINNRRQQQQQQQQQQRQQQQR